MKIDIIGVPLYYGCDRKGVEKGPNKLRDLGLINIFKEKGHCVTDLDNINVNFVDNEGKYSTNDKLKYLEEVVNVNKSLCNVVNQSLKNMSFPLIIGGDHSLAIGSVAGASNYSENFAVIWIDAHGDINTSETSPSGNIHGMPLSASMGIGETVLTNIGSETKKVKAENVFILGARDLDSGENELIKDLNLAVWSTEEIQKQGVEKVVEELFELLRRRGIEKIHLSFDIDVIDPNYTPGTGTAVKNGLEEKEACYMLEQILKTKKVISMDFVEFNPEIESARTSKVCLKILKLVSDTLAL